MLTETQDAEKIVNIQAKFQDVRNAINAFDFIIGHGYYEGNGLITIRQEMAKLVGAPTLMICGYCGKTDECGEYKTGEQCLRCNNGKFEVAKEEPES